MDSLAKITVYLALCASISMWPVGTLRHLHHRLIVLIFPNLCNHCGGWQNRNLEWLIVLRFPHSSKQPLDSILLGTWSWEEVRKLPSLQCIENGSKCWTLSEIPHWLFLRCAGELGLENLTITYVKFAWLKLEFTKFGLRTITFFCFVLRYVIIGMS